MIYISVLRNKIIYCPCDTEDSNYVKYLKNNKERLQYKELLYTSLQEGFDFTTESCKKYFERADIVITNPPFSKLVKFIEIVLSYNCDFLLLVPPTTYGLNIFIDLLKQDKVRLGFSHRSGGVYFITPNKENDNKNIGVRYITTLNIPTYKSLIFNKSYKEGLYKYIDGTDIINIDKTKDIPDNYYNIMAVPISFLSNYDNKQFNILGKIDGCVNGVKIFKRLLVQRKEKSYE